MSEVQIAGEARTIAAFSAYKALTAGEVIADVEGAWREILNQTAEFKRDYEARNYVEMDRAEARRQFRARPMVEVVREEDPETGAIRVREVPVTLESGAPMLGPDPLGHLSEEDWASSGGKLRIPDSPSEMTQWMAMAPTALRLARAQVTRLIGLVLTPNADLEKWDTEGLETADIDKKLDEAGRAVIHRASADELVRLLAGTVRVCREQLRDPFDELVGEFRAMRGTPDEEEELPPVAGAMEIETEGESSIEEPQISSSASPADSDGSPPSSSTAPAGSESSISATA